MRCTFWLASKLSPPIRAGHPRPQAPSPQQLNMRFSNRGRSQDPRDRDRHRSRGRIQRAPSPRGPSHIGLTPSPLSSGPSPGLLCKKCTARAAAPSPEPRHIKKNRIRIKVWASVTDLITSRESQAPNHVKFGFPQPWDQSRRSKTLQARTSPDKLA